MPPKLVECLEAGSCFAKSAADICEGAAVISDDDSEVLGLALVCSGGTVCEVDVVWRVHLEVDAFGLVELEVVL